MFLLDEPDISLHPKWQQDFISNFTKGLNEESMAVITTHSPSVASDLFDNNLYLIRKGKIITKAFKYYGKNVDDILCDYLVWKVREIRMLLKELIIYGKRLIIMNSIMLSSKEKKMS